MGISWSKYIAKIRKAAAPPWWARFKSVAPMVKSEFRGQLAFYIFVQGAIVIAWISVFLWSRRVGNVDVELLSLFIFALIQIFVGYRCRLTEIACRRTLDIYPQIYGKKCTPLICSALLFIPLTCVFFLIFLSVKEQDKEATPPLPFRMPVKFSIGLVACSLVPLIATTIVFQNRRSLQTRSIAYAVSSPTAYYFTSLTDEVKSMLPIKDDPKLASNPSGTLKAVEALAAKHPLSSTGYILGLAIDVYARVVAEKSTGRKIANYSSNQEGLDLMDDIITMTELWEHGTPDVLRYNPINWINSTGGLELSLITFVQTTIKAREMQQVYSNIAFLLNGLEKKLKRSPNNAADLARIHALRARFEGLPNHKTYESLKSSRVWRFLAEHGA